MVTQSVKQRNNLCHQLLCYKGMDIEASKPASSNIDSIRYNIDVSLKMELTPSSSSSSFNFKAHENSKSIQIKARTTRQETALTVKKNLYKLLLGLLYLYFLGLCS